MTGMMVDFERAPLVHGIGMSILLLSHTCRRIQGGSPCRVGIRSASRRDCSRSGASLRVVELRCKRQRKSALTSHMDSDLQLPH